ncbi:hypothetical protein ABTF47_16270, partial [Acinetobacter baumannii]
MDNYKIKVKDEAESKEAQELFFELGFRWEWTQDKEVLRGSTPYLFTLGVNIGYGLSLTKFDECVGKELTLPQLRDLVVLKRNDINDATHTCENDFKYICIDERWHLMTTDGWFHVSVNPKALKPINQPQDPALISGADVPSLIKAGKEVQFRSVFNVQGGGEWKDLDLERDEEEFSLGDLINTRFEWRLKPQTIKVELELPKPFEPEEDCHVYILDDGKTD